MNAFRMSRGAATTVLNRLGARGLVTSVGENLYITQRGLEMLAARDRVDAGRLVEVTHLDPEGEAAIRERCHDSAVAETAAAFRGAGIPVVAGWRWLVSWSDGQLVPDLWVLLPVPGREEGIWVPVEVEFSAKTKKRIEEKYRSYRLAPVRLNRMFPILVITGEALPAKRFDDQAGDLPVLTTTRKAFLTGVWEGPESVWRRKGRSVGLSDFAREHRAHLWQRTGRSLDYSEPTPEVWEGFLGEESFWTDPQTEGLAEALGLDLPPIDPQLQAAMDRVLNEAKAGAGPSANKPVSAPMPPTPPRTTPTAPVRARQRLQALSRISSLVASADSRAGIRLEQDDLTAEESLCLQRVRAIITYGANRHYQAEEPRVEQSLQHCLMLKDQHVQAVRSRNFLWCLVWCLVVSRTKTDPRQAFRSLLKDYPNMRQDACKQFNGWSRMVDRAARASRPARTLE